MPPVGFKLSVSAVERPQTHALDRATTRTGPTFEYNTEIFVGYLRKAVKTLRQGN
jgi:hypothetical protein